MERNIVQALKLNGHTFDTTVAKNAMLTLEDHKNL